MNTGIWAVRGRLGFYVQVWQLGAVRGRVTRMHASQRARGAGSSRKLRQRAGKGGCSCFAGHHSQARRIQVQAVADFFLPSQGFCNLRLVPPA